MRTPPKAEAARLRPEPGPQTWGASPSVGESLQVKPYAIMLRLDDPTFKNLLDGLLALSDKLAT